MKRIPATRNGELDFWKFIFSIVVIVHHSSALFDGEYKYFQFGSLAVEFFFIVSGYLFAGSVLRKKEPYNPDTIGSETASFIFKKAYGLWYFFAFAAILRLVVNILLKGLRDTVLCHKFFTIIFDFLFINMTGIPTVNIIGTSWYISALLLVMAILYPIFRKRKDLFLSLISPLTPIILYGIMMKHDGFVLSTSVWYDIMLKGVLRGFAGITLGCFTYKVALMMQENPLLTKTGKLTPHLLSLVEIACLLGSIVGMYIITDKNYSSQPVIVFVYAVAISICASKMSSISNLFSYSIFSYLGKLSMSVFLVHSPVIGLMQFILKKSDAFRAFRDSAYGVPLTVTILVFASLAVGIIAIPICEFIKKKVDNYILKLKAK